MTAEAKSPMDELKARTRHHHQDTEQTRFAQRLMRGELSLREYGHMLWAYALLHEDLERALQACIDPSVARVFEPALASSGPLREDLASLGMREDQVDPHVANAAREGCVPWTDLRCPLRLLGRLYVYEGARLGGVVIGASLRRALGPGLPMHYFGVEPRAAFGRFAAFKARMNAALGDCPDLEAAVEAAEDTFDAVGGVFVALDGLHGTSYARGAPARAPVT